MSLDFRLSLEPSLTQCVDLYFVLQVMTDFSSLGKHPYIKNFPLGALLKIIWKTDGDRWNCLWRSCGSPQIREDLLFLCSTLLIRKFLLEVHFWCGWVLPALLQGMAGGWVCSATSFGTDSKAGDVIYRGLLWQCRGGWGTFACELQWNLRLCCVLFMACFQMLGTEIICLINNTNKQTSNALCWQPRQPHVEWQPARKLEAVEQLCFHAILQVGKDLQEYQYLTECHHFHQTTSSSAMPTPFWTLEG